MLTNTIDEAESDGVIALELIWPKMRREAAEIAENEPALGALVSRVVLQFETLGEALAFQLANKLRDDHVRAEFIIDACLDAYAAKPDLLEAALHDIQAVFSRDPVCLRYIQPLLYFKGFLALQAQRVEHWLWHNGSKDLALFLQSRVSELFAVDIHPATIVGKGIFFDHSTGIVIGATAEIGDDVSILQGVTLGGTGKDDGDRHPKIRSGALISCGAKVLGNIEVGKGARIAAGSVVLKAVEPGTTVAGVPAKKVGVSADPSPAKSMDQNFYFETYSI